MNSYWSQWDHRDLMSMYGIEPLTIKEECIEIDTEIKIEKHNGCNKCSGIGCNYCLMLEY